jgi:hypothetical protein
MALNSTGYNTPIEALQFLDQQTLSNGFPVFGIAFLMMITVAIFMALSGQTSARRFAVTFSVMGVVSFLGFLIGWIDISVFTFYLIGFAISVVFLRMESNK